MPTVKSDHPENSDAGRKAQAAAVAADQKVASNPQEVMDRQLEQGFRGVEVDPTPNENYTLAGVTSGAPTPETDEAAAEAARKAQADTAVKAAGVSER